MRAALLAVVVPLTLATAPEPISAHGSTGQVVLAPARTVDHSLESLAHQPRAARAAGDSPRCGGQHPFVLPARPADTRPPQAAAGLAPSPVPRSAGFAPAANQARAPPSAS